LDKASFDKLLTWLDADRKNAATRYEECRKALIDFFRNKGARHSEECADATFDRVIDIIHGGRMGERKNPVSYFIRVAHFIRLEYLRNPANIIGNPEAQEDWQADNTARETEDEWIAQRRQECMEKCLNALPLDSRELISGYYEIRIASEKAKKKVKNLEEMAKRLQKTPNAIRIEVHRMRSEKLKPCLKACIKNFLE